MTLKEWVKKNFGDLELLGASHFGYRPGVILDPDSLEIINSAWELLDQPPDGAFWRTQRGPGLLASRSFKESRDHDGVIKVPGIVSIAVKSQSAVEAEFVAEHVSVEVLTGSTVGGIETRLRTRWKDGQDPNGVWIRYIDGKLVVSESWFCNRLTVKLNTNGQRIVKADAEKQVELSGSFKWSSEDTLTFDSDGQAPFAVRGLKP